MKLDIGTQLGDYRILSVIGRGAYGIVFEAEHVITRRIDAVKLLHDCGPASADDEQRFLREIQVQASLDHPNIAAVHTAFRTPSGLALVMEKVPGEPLSAILKRGRLPLSVGIRYILATLSALSCAERSGIVHRDIKPDNILITPEGQVKITDFGLAHIWDGARITPSGESLGTPCYMSPEQVAGTDPVDRRTDVYSTAVVLYEIVTGKPPFHGSNGFAVMLAHRNTPPVPPVDVDPAVGVQLSRAIVTALEKNPAHRFQSAAEFHKELMKAMSPIPAPAAAPAARSTWWHSRRAVLGASAAMFLCGLMALAAHSTWQKDGAVARPVESTPAAPPRVAAPRRPEPEPEPTPAATVPVDEPQPKTRAFSSRPVGAKKVPLRAGGLQFTGEPQPTAKEPDLSRETKHDVEPERAAPPPPPEPSHEAQVQIPELTAAPLSSPANAEIKRPNVLKRTITKIFGKRDKREPPQESLPAGKPTAK